MPTAEQKQLVAGSTAALLAVALLVPSEAKRKAIGRTKIIFELAQMQLQSLLAGRNEADNSFGDYLDANLDVFRFLSKVMYAYKCDLLDTRGDYLQTAPPHLQHMKDVMARKAAKEGDGNSMSMDGPGMVIKDLVLIGGGHSHVHVLWMLGMARIPGVQVTLVTRDVETPYSGMLPGHVAGFYSREECHLDLDRLAVFAGVRLVHAECVGVDRTNKQVLLRGGRPPIPYDVLSINIGSAPQVTDTSSSSSLSSPSSSSSPGGAAQPCAIPVKPIDGFGKRWDALLARVEATDFVQDASQNNSSSSSSSYTPLRLCVVGGGAGGVELALAMQHRLRGLLQSRGLPPDQILHVSLVSRAPTVLPTHSARVQAIFTRTLKERGINLVAGCEVQEALPNALKLSNGHTLPFDECVWCTQGSAQGWVKASGFDVDDRGFLQVNTQLQSTNTPGVFGAGDIASIVGYPRPKAGVFAVMAGMPLAVNLRKKLEGDQHLEHYKPQTAFLGLLGLGDGGCVASRGRMALEGKELWALKDWIDRKWLHVYKDGLPDMSAMHGGSGKEGGGSAAGAKAANKNLVAASAGPEALAALAAQPMRCGGCGAKVGATTLSRVMKKVSPLVVRRPEVLVGVDSPDDCAVVRAAPNSNLLGVFSVDFFRSFYEDPYIFGQIAATHALSDCHAMGVPAVSALAIAVLPFGLEDKVGDSLMQMMAGACAALSESNCALVGGHTCEGTEMALGFAINGASTAEHHAGTAGGSSDSKDSNNAGVLAKGGMVPGQAIVLTQGLGTGVLFAARMRNQTKGPWVTAALQRMCQSSRVAAGLATEHGASACTDVTGFGLAGHLAEMCKASGPEVGAELWLSTVPLLEGAKECVAKGIFSSLQPANLRLRRAVNVDENSAIAHDPSFALLFDPQTSGGLLTSVPMDRASDLVQALKGAGYADSCVIGRVVERVADSNDPNGPSIQLLP